MVTYTTYQSRVRGRIVSVLSRVPNKHTHLDSDPSKFKGHMLFLAALYLLLGTKQPTGVQIPPDFVLIPVWTGCVLNQIVDFTVSQESFLGPRTFWPFTCIYNYLNTDAHFVFYVHKIVLCLQRIAGFERIVISKYYIVLYSRAKSLFFSLNVFLWMYRELEAFGLSCVFK